MEGDALLLVLQFKGPQLSQIFASGIKESVFVAYVIVYAIYC